jgi:hypothetical protein
MDQPAARRAFRSRYPLEDRRTDPPADAIRGTLTCHPLIIT